MTDNLKVRALELAHGDGKAPHSDVIQRASVYHAWLEGKLAAGGGPGTPAGNTTSSKATKAAADKPTAAAPGGKPANKPAAGKGAEGSAPSGNTKAPGGTHTQDEVRDIIRRVAQTKGKTDALELLKDEGSGAQSVSALKPADYDKVYEACVVLLGESEGEAAENAEDIY